MIQYTSPVVSKKQVFLPLLVCLLAVTFSMQAAAQFKPTPVIRSTNIIESQGAKFYLHEVKAGHTLYSISKAYNISVKVIGQENPEISMGALRVGQTLRIPYVEITDPVEEEAKDLVNYLYHVVEPRQTLLTVSRMYNVTVQEIIRENPGVDQVLPAGKEIRIPRKSVSPARNTPLQQEDESFRYHEVQPQETLFSLSRQYGLPVKTIKEANPGLRWGLRIGEIIRIPLDQEYTPEAVTDYRQDETLATDPAGLADVREALPDSSAATPTEWTGDCNQLIQPHPETRFQVAYLLPLYVTVNDTLGASDTLPRPQHDMYADAIRFLEFLEGSLLAIDSLRQSGLSMDVHLFDTERDPAVVSRLIADGSLRDMDLIIGPVYPETIEIVSAYSRLQRIPMVSPLSSRGIGLADNPYLFQVNPSVNLQQDLASIYLSRFYNKNILLVLDPADQNFQTSRYSSNIRNYLTYKINPNDLRYRQILFSEEQRMTDLEDSLAFRLEDVLSLNRDNLVIIPSTDKVFVADMINRLNNLTLHYNITVFGRPEWGNFDALQLESLYNLNLHYYTNFSNPYVNYADSLTLEVCNRFRSNFNNEPGRFSFQGFDVTFYFIKALYLFGGNLVPAAGCWPLVLQHPTLQTSFHFVRSQDGSGFENQALSIVRYNRQSLVKEKISSTAVILPE